MVGYMQIYKVCDEEGLHGSLDESTSPAGLHLPRVPIPGTGLDANMTGTVEMRLIELYMMIYY